jgi:NAD+ synthase (glutamine-hydrolysing)
MEVEMIEGFVRVAAISPDTKVGNCFHNAAQIETAARTAAAAGARIICFPELSLTGYTCGDLFLQDSLLDGAKDALLRLVRGSEGHEEVVVVGLPFAQNGKLFNVAAVYSDGILHGLIPKTHIPNYGEFYELRHFTPADDTFSNDYVTFTACCEREDGDQPSTSGHYASRALSDKRSSRTGAGVEPDALYGQSDAREKYMFEDVPFGKFLLFECEDEPELVFAVEICEDLWVADAPSSRHAHAGAKIILNLSAGNETIGKAAYRRLLVNSQSGRLVCGYVYANAGFGESSSDLVFSGHSIISENGTLLAESPPFGKGVFCSGDHVSDNNCPKLRLQGNEKSAEAGLLGGSIVLSDIDLLGLAADRRSMNTYRTDGMSPLEYETVFFSQGQTSGVEEHRSNGKVVSINKMKNADASCLYHRILPHPFVPADRKERAERCEEILNMQSFGLAKRLLHTGSETAVIGISGGLDSTLALLVSVRAAKILGKTPDFVTALTMPGFGTTDATKGNAHRLCEALGVNLSEIDIRSSVEEHLRSIGRSVAEHDVVFENAQARVRTLTLMDIANLRRGIVVGTGDLSELALGWATYNGDHMSMYGVNAGVPKTLVRHIIRYVAETTQALTAVLNDILDTPVSPELLPPSEGAITQKTEEIIGPYELHDFFLYHAVRWKRKPGIILKLAKIAFSDHAGQEDPSSAHNKTTRADAPKHSAKREDGIGADAAYQDPVGRYDEATIRKWLKVFYQRFFAHQFKRNALPDGPKIGSVSLSPRGDWRMPSDAEISCWLRELE